jgi:hypothetical protein
MTSSPANQRANRGRRTPVYAALPEHVPASSQIPAAQAEKGRKFSNSVEVPVLPWTSFDTFLTPR